MIDVGAITPSKVQATRNPHRELIEALTNFEKATKVVYRPERPRFV